MIFLPIKMATSLSHILIHSGEYGTLPEQIRNDVDDMSRNMFLVFHARHGNATIVQCLVRCGVDLRALEMAQQEAPNELASKLEGVIREKRACRPIHKQVLDYLATTVPRAIQGVYDGVVDTWHELFMLHWRCR